MSVNVKSVTVAAALAACLGLPGCQVFLPFIALWELAFPHDKVPAQFKLPKDKRVLVFPDDMNRPVAYPPVKRALAEKVGKVLVEKKAVAYAVPYDELIDLQHSEPNFNRLAVATVGRKLGADLVILVNIDQFQLKDSPVSTLWRGRFSAKVRVVDVRKGRLWPDESAGRPVSASEPVCDNSSETYGTVLSQLLADKLGTEVAQLFHAHHVDRHRPKDTEPQWDE
jgi:hypothetical protein